MPFSITIILFITYGLESDNNVLHHDLINIIENIWKVFYEGNIDCGAFDTLDHQKLLAKVNH